MQHLQRAALIGLFSVLMVFPTPTRAAQPGVPSSSPATVPATEAVEVFRADTTFQDLGYGDTTARTMYGSLDYFFPVPAGHVPQPGSRVELVFSHSPLLVPDRSTMTAVVNGQSVASVFLTPETQGRARLSVPLPVDGFRGNGFFMQLQFSLRLTRDECEEVQNPALWATVHRDSRLLLTTRPSLAGMGLEDLAALFTPTSKDTPPLALVLPPDPQPEELEAAGLVAFQLGRWSAATGQDPRLELAATPDPDRPSILVGNGAALNLPQTWGTLSWDGQTFTASGGRIPSSHGVMALSQSAVPQLLVSGATPSAVRSAADALVQPERRALLSGTHAVLTRVPVTPAAAAAWQDGAASFAQLGVDRREVRGPGEHILDFRFERPANWILREGSALELALESSTAIRTDTSWVSVSLNGAEIGTQRLRTGTDMPQRYRFNLPVGVLNTDLNGQPVRHLALQVRLFLDIPHVACTTVDADSAWAALLPYSAWLLPHDEFTGLDLGRFPAPLLSDDTTAPLSVVVPEPPTSADLAAGLQVLAALGRWIDTDVAFPPRLMTTDQVGTQAHQQSLILIGGPEHNSVSATAASLQPALFTSADPAAYQLTAGERRSRLHLAQSPWNRTQVILVITGSDSAGLALGAAALGERALLDTLRGQTAMLVEGLPPQTLAAATPAGMPPTELAPRVETLLIERAPAWQVVGAVVLGAFMAGLGVIGATRWRRRGGA